MVILACNLTACGYKGGLKSPSQIKAEEAKKARKAAKEAKDNAKAAPADATIPDTMTSTSPVTPPPLPDNVTPAGMINTKPAETN